MTLTAWAICGPWRPSLKASLRAWKGERPSAGSMYSLKMASGSFGGDFFDIHAALLGGHEDDAGGGSVDDGAEVELAVDGRAFFNEQALHFLSGGPGLVRDQLHAENGFGRDGGVFHVFDDFNAATFAAAAGVNLRLDDDGLVAGGEELLGGGIGFFQRGGHFTVGNGHAVLAEDGFGLVLVNLHGCSG